MIIYDIYITRDGDPWVCLSSRRLPSRGAALRKYAAYQCCYPAWVTRLSPRYGLALIEHTIVSVDISNARIS